MHPIKRVKKRFGVDIKLIDLIKMAEGIRSNKTVCLYKLSKRKSIHAINYKDKVILYALYNSRCGRIVTFVNTSFLINQCGLKVKNITNVV